MKIAKWEELLYMLWTEQAREGQKCMQGSYKWLMDQQAHYCWFIGLSTFLGTGTLELSSKIWWRSLVFGEKPVEGCCFLETDGSLCYKEEGYGSSLRSLPGMQYLL